MAQYQSPGILLLVVIFSMFWSCVVMVQVLFRMLLCGGPKKYLAVKKRERTSVLDNPDLGTHGYLTLKTLKIHYVANGEEGKPLMLFLHGFPEFWYTWRHQLKEFGRDYRAVAIDMRGYGESDKPSGIEQYTTDKLAEDVKDVIDALGYEKATIVSHDWGGSVGWVVASLYPEVVEHLVVCNCGHPSVMKKQLLSSPKQILSSWYMLFFQMPWLPEIVLASEDLKHIDDGFTSAPNGARAGTFKLLDMEAWKYTFSKPGALTPPLNYYRATMRYLPGKRGQREVQAPTLVIWGTGDQALGKDMAEMCMKYCKDGRVKYVEGASHWVQQEEPQKVNDLIREFLCTDNAD